MLEKGKKKNGVMNISIQSSVNIFEVFTSLLWLSEKKGKCVAAFNAKWKRERTFQTLCCL